MSTHGAGARCVETPRNRSKLGNKRTQTDAIPEPQNSLRARAHPDVLCVRILSTVLLQLAERTSHALAILESENTGDPVAEVWNEFFLDDVDSRRQVFLQEQVRTVLSASLPRSLLSSLSTFLHLPPSFPLSSSTPPFSASISISLLVFSVQVHISPGSSSLFTAGSMHSSVVCPVAVLTRRSAGH